MTLPENDRTNDISRHGYDPEQQARATQPASMHVADPSEPGSNVPLTAENLDPLTATKYPPSIGY